jgi:pimeloyl-ACP methyl ester carboxylesterase
MRTATAFVTIPSLMQILTGLLFFRTAGSSANQYYETLHDAAAKKRKARNMVPTGVAVSLTQDVAIRRWAQRDNNIVSWFEFDRGGHFAALEVPAFLAGDMRNFFRRLR